MSFNIILLLCAVLASCGKDPSKISPDYVHQDEPQGYTDSILSTLKDPQPTDIEAVKVFLEKNYSIALNTIKKDLSGPSSPFARLKQIISDDAIKDMPAYNAAIDDMIKYVNTELGTINKSQKDELERIAGKTTYFSIRDVVRDAFAKAAAPITDPKDIDELNRVVQGAQLALTASDKAKALNAPKAAQAAREAAQAAYEKAAEKAKAFAEEAQRVAKLAKTASEQAGTDLGQVAKAAQQAALRAEQAAHSVSKLIGEHKEFTKAASLAQEAKKAAADASQQSQDIDEKLADNATDDAQKAVDKATADADVAAKKAAAAAQDAANKAAGPDKVAADKAAADARLAAEAAKTAADKAAAAKATAEQRIATLYQTLKSDSNEAVLIDRAAQYVVKFTKEPAYLLLATTTDGKKEIQASVETVFKAKNFQDIFYMIKKMLAVHRCSKDTLLGINNLGFFISSEIINIGKSGGGLQFSNASVDAWWNVFKQSYNRSDLKYIIEYAMISFAIDNFDPSIDSNINFTEPSECSNMSKKDLNEFGKCQKSIHYTDDAESKQLVSGITGALKSKSGIDYYKDVILQTNKFVFSTLGINRNSAYGNIAIILNQGLLKNSWSTPVAATFFNNFNMGSANGPIYYGALYGRVWITGKPWKLAPSGMNEAEQDYIKSQIRGSRDVLALVAATDMLGRLVAYYKDNTELIEKNKLQPVMSSLSPVMSFSEVSTTHIRKYMEIIDSHALIEVHIPPFPAVETKNVVTTEVIFQTLPNILNNFPTNKFIKVNTLSEINAATEIISAPQ